MSLAMSTRFLRRSCGVLRAFLMANPPTMNAATIGTNVFVDDG
jgi:hypothetical protein